MKGKRFKPSKFKHGKLRVLTNTGSVAKGRKPRRWKKPAKIKLYILGMSYKDFMAYTPDSNK